MIPSVAGLQVVGLVATADSVFVNSQGFTLSKAVVSDTQPEAGEETTNL